MAEKAAVAPELNVNTKGPLQTNTWKVYGRTGTMVEEASPVLLMGKTLLFQLFWLVVMFLLWWSWNLEAIKYDIGGKEIEVFLHFVNNGTKDNYRDLSIRLHDAQCRQIYFKL